MTESLGLLHWPGALSCSKASDARTYGVEKPREYSPHTCQARKQNRSLASKSNSTNTYLFDKHEAQSLQKAWCHALKGRGVKGRRPNIKLGSLSPKQQPLEAERRVHNVLSSHLREGNEGNVMAKTTSQLKIPKRCCCLRQWQLSPFRNVTLYQTGLPRHLTKGSKEGRRFCENHSRNCEFGVTGGTGWWYGLLLFLIKGIKENIEASG